jgi:hypothetical protein
MVNAMIWRTDDPPRRAAQTFVEEVESLLVGS